MDDIKRFQAAVRSVYGAVEQLHAVFPSKPFTPDGRMIGDIGEAIAALTRGVTLYEGLPRNWDGYRITQSGERHEVQIKATQGDWTYLKEPPHNGDLIVIRIVSDGSWECCYDGSIMAVWEALNHLHADNGAKWIRIRDLRLLNGSK